MTCSESQLWFAHKRTSVLDQPSASLLCRVEFAVAFGIRSCSLFPESMDLLKMRRSNFCLPDVHFVHLAENYSRQSCHCSERPVSSYICFRHESGLERALGHVIDLHAAAVGALGLTRREAGFKRFHIKHLQSGYRILNSF